MEVDMRNNFLSLYLRLCVYFRRPGKGDFQLILSLLGTAILCALIALLLFAPQAFALALSPGDRVNVAIEHGEPFAGKYQVNLHGELEFPYLGRVQVAGLESDQAAGRISRRLVEERYFQPDILRVSLQVLNWAPIDVAVEGAVFSPGQIRINVPNPKESSGQPVEELPGGSLPERRLSDALRGAGGVRPTADLSEVLFIRGTQARLVDLSGWLDGRPAPDLFLIAGDRIVVPTSPVINPALARPSRITPPGIKVYVSNLVTPAGNNAAASVPSTGVSMGYGSRLSQGVVAANCTGGIRATNAGRRTVLVRTDRLSGKTQTWETDIETLLQEADDTRNPILMEGDALACYDSTTTNVRDIFRTLSDILLPFSFWPLRR
jgi:polysaccharide export outer membrane protein